MIEIKNKLRKVTKRQDEYDIQYFSQLNRPTYTDPVCASDVAAAQGLLLNDFNKMLSSLKMSVEQLANQIYVNERHLDDLNQYSRSN